MTSLNQLTERSLGGLQVSAVEDTAEFLNILVYGDPGIGKTVLAGSAAAVAEMAPVLFVDVEGGTYSLRDRYPGVDVVRVQSWQDVQKLYDELYRGDHGYKTIVIDSLTEMQKFSMYTIMTALVKDDPARDPDVPGMREWGKNIEQIRKLVRAFRDLPCNTIITALAMTDKDARTGITRTKPSLSGKLSNEVAGFLDIVLYMYIKVVDGEIQRLLLSTATDTQVAKDRSGRLPMVIENPTMQTIMNVIKNKEQTNED